MTTASEPRTPAEQVAFLAVMAACDCIDEWIAARKAAERDEAAA